MLAQLKLSLTAFFEGVSPSRININDWGQSSRINIVPAGLGSLVILEIWRDL